jgi:hypothetical protein
MCYNRRKKEKITMKKSDIGFTGLFKIKSSKAEPDKYVEIMLSKDVKYFGIQQDAYTLRLLLLLSTKMKDYKVETNFKQLIQGLGLHYSYKNIDKIKEDLSRLEISAVKYVIKKPKEIQKISVNLIVHCFMQSDRKQSTVIIRFDPNAYSSILPSIDFDIDKALQLAKKNVNKFVILYAVYEMLRDRKGIEFNVEDLFPLWTKPAESIQVKKIRKSFIVQTLKELQDCMNIKVLIDGEKVEIKREKVRE